jgi:hypothetical protein
MIAIEDRILDWLEGLWVRGTISPRVYRVCLRLLLYLVARPHAVFSLRKAQFLAQIAHLKGQV